MKSKNNLQQMKAIKISLFFVLIISLLGGCKIGKNYQKVEVETPTDFRFLKDSTKANVDINWWDIFQDPVLDTLVSHALLNNNDLLIAAQNVEQARLGVSIQRSAMLPNFDVSANAGRGNYAGFKLDDASNNFNLIGSLNWEIDLWGKFRRLNEAAKAQFLSTTYGYQFMRISLISTVATTYFQLIEFREKLSISQSTLEIRDKSVNIIGQRFNAGIIPEIDLNHAQIQREIAAASVPYYKRMVAQTENYLSVLIGQLPQQIDNGKPLENILINPDIPIGLPSELLGRRPDILGAEQMLVAQNAFIGAAQADRLPSISLTGLFGGASTDLSTFISGGAAWSVGAGLVSPLFHWKEKSNRVKIERSRYESTIHTYDNVVLNAFREVEDALIAIETLKEQQVAFQRRVDASINAMELSGERYDRGVANYIEYLESQRQAFESQLDLVSTKQNLLTAYVQLYKALGGGWSIDDGLGK